MGDVIIERLNLRVVDVTYTGNNRTAVKTSLWDNWECTLSGK